MSPDAVWQDGCAAKSAEPVWIQAPHRRAARSHEGKGGPERVAKATRRLITTSEADSVGDTFRVDPRLADCHPATIISPSVPRLAAGSFSR